MLGDDYISQHITQAYRDYMEKTSYKAYMSNMMKNVVSMLSVTEISASWSDILIDFDKGPEKQTETEQQIKSRLLAKLNGREG